MKDPAVVHAPQAPTAARRSLSLLVLVPTALLVCLLVALGTAHGAPDEVTVTTTTDEVNGDTDSIAALISTPGGDGISLREAIIAANNTPGMDEIALPSGTYTLTIEGSGEDLAAAGDLDITDDLTITGAGASTTIIDAGGMTTDPDRVFHLAPDWESDVNVEMVGLTISNGWATSGGGIYQPTPSGALSMVDCMITDNSADQGGGLSLNATSYLTNTTVTNNNATTADGGGINNWSSDLTLSGCTISHNSAGLQGGASPTDSET
jgi:hypothetical protein